jgi:predicted nucleic acid-binding protein
MGHGNRSGSKKTLLRLWIVAIALEHNLVIATRDAHFGEIDVTNAVTELIDPQ